MDGGGGHRTNRCRTWTPPPKSKQLVNCGCSLQEKKAPATRIFSPLAVPGLCVTIGRYWYLFKRLTAVSAGRFYRFEHIVTYSSGKVVAKSPEPARSVLALTLNARLLRGLIQPVLSPHCPFPDLSET